LIELAYLSLKKEPMSLEINLKQIQKQHSTTTSKKTGVDNTKKKKGGEN
jgi:hypothetical protein